MFSGDIETCLRFVLVLSLSLSPVLSSVFCSHIMAECSVLSLGSLPITSLYVAGLLMTFVIACDGRLVTLAQSQSVFNKSQSDPAVTSILLLNYPEGHGQKCWRARDR